MQNKPPRNKSPDAGVKSQAYKNSRFSLSVILGFGGVIVAIALLVFGKAFLNIDSAQMNSILGALSESPWGLPVTIGIFCATAFIGVPQWMLITASVLAFGPVIGGIYAWVATLTSAALDFWIARRVGTKALHGRIEIMSRETLKKLTQAIRKNGFVTSFVVRLVPTGPFVLVNFAAGLSQMRFDAFLAGTALGIIPKIMVVMLIGLGVVSGVNQSYMAIVFAVLASLVIVISVLAQRRLKSKP